MLGGKYKRKWGGGNQLIFVYIRTRITGMKEYIRLALRELFFSTLRSFSLQFYGVSCYFWLARLWINCMCGNMNAKIKENKRNPSPIVKFVRTRI